MFLIDKIDLILPMLKSLGGVLKNLFLGFFLFRQGENKEVVRETKKEVKDAKQGNKTKNHISKLPDNALNSGLRKPTESPKE